VREKNKGKKSAGKNKIREEKKVKKKNEDGK